MSRVDLFSLITQFTRSTDTRRSSRAHRGVRGALVPGLVTESRADGLESRRLCGPGGYHPWSRPEQHRAEYLQVCRSRSGIDSEAKTLAQVKPRSRSRRAAATRPSGPSHQGHRKWACSRGPVLLAVGSLRWPAAQQERRQSKVTGAGTCAPGLPTHYVTSEARNA